MDAESDEIVCPHCGYIQDTDTKYRYVTYWGDDGDHKSCTCEHCDKDFFVDENVTRTFRCYIGAKTK